MIYVGILAVIGLWIVGGTDRDSAAELGVYDVAIKRFDNADTTWQRIAYFVDDFTRGINEAPLGTGIGRGQVGGYAATGQQVDLYYCENEFGRIIMEIGILGFAAVLSIRVRAIWMVACSCVPIPIAACWLSAPRHCLSWSLRACSVSPSITSYHRSSGPWWPWWRARFVWKLDLRPLTSGLRPLTSDPMKSVLLSHPFAKADAQGVAGGLCAAGILAAFYTGVAAEPGSLAARCLTGISRWAPCVANRLVPGVDQSRIRSLGVLEVVARMGEKVCATHVAAAALRG